MRQQSPFSVADSAFRMKSARQIKSARFLFSFQKIELSRDSAQGVFFP